MTTHHTDPGPGQLDLFGRTTTGPDDGGALERRRSDSNDVELMHTVAGNAIRCGYLLVGASERVYARVEGHDGEATRVPRYEEDAVHQLLRRRWLTLGAAHRVTCGAASLVGTAVLVPKDTRTRVERWQHLQRPPSWPTQSTDPACSTSGRVIPLNSRRRRR